MSRGDAAGALAAFKQAYTELPENTEALMYYAAMLIRTGQDAEADQVLAPAIASGVAADPRISSAYASRGEFNKIAQIWQAHIKARPDDTQAYFTLAAAYYNENDKADAIQTLEDVAQKDPTTAQDVQTYIAQIKNGTAPKQ
jgi:thioredoxin-like negative regulator of GroEL